MTDWRVTSSLFASGDRKVQLVYVADTLPDPDQVAAIYTKLALMFTEAKRDPDDADAQVHRIELVITPEIEPIGEGK